MKAIVMTAIALFTVTTVSAKNTDLDRFMSHYAGRSDFQTAQMDAASMPKEMSNPDEKASIDNLYVIGSADIDDQMIRDTKMDVYLLSDRQNYERLAEFTVDNGREEITIYGKENCNGDLCGLIIVEHSLRKNSLNFVIMEGTFDGELIAALKAAGEAEQMAGLF